MNTIVGKDFKSVYLVLIEQLTKFEIVRELKDRTPNIDKIIEIEFSSVEINRNKILEILEKYKNIRFFSTCI